MTKEEFLKQMNESCLKEGIAPVEPCELFEKTYEILKANGIIEV